MARVLVVYYSRTGTTKRVAAQIASLLSADLEEIVDRAPRAGVRGYVRSAIEAMLGKEADIAAPQHAIGDYDAVVLGTPTWSGSLSSPARTFLREHGGELKNAAFFCTSGGRGGSRVLGQMKRLYGGTPLSTLAVREKRVSRGEADPVVERFARAVRLGLGAEPARPPAEAAPAHA